MLAVNKSSTVFALDASDSIDFEYKNYGRHSNIHIIQADIRDIGKIPMDGIDTIIHLANIANDPTSDLNSKLTWEVNVLASKFLIEKAIEYGATQFIYASSGSVYGIKDEPNVHEDMSLEPLTDYSIFKMNCEQILAELSLIHI